MKKFQLVNVFEDDHESCCNFTYDGKKFSLWWAAVEAIAAFEYDDSARAQAILKPISEVLDKMIESGEKQKGTTDEDYRHTEWGFLDYGWNGYAR
jgi:hypothetical protein